MKTFALSLALVLASAPAAFAADITAQPTHFTDPPFGPPKFFDDPRKELPFSGVYSWKDGRLRLQSRELRGPNGIVFSPDERSLYVSNWDPDAKTVTRYPYRIDLLQPGVRP